MSKERGCNMWNTLLTDNSTSMRLLRTIIQGIIGVIIANLDVIIGTFSIQPELKALIVGLVMAILSPIMAEIGKNLPNNGEVIVVADDESGAELDDDVKVLE
jgi:hypothetical protein